ncbi:MAG: hypothetical protein WC508_05900 [Patescibacteria group bacterium]
MANPNFDEQKNTSLLFIDNNLVDLRPLQNLAQANGFVAKPDFHMTVIGFKPGRDIDQVLKRLPTSQRANIIEQIKTLLASTDWQFNLKPEYYQVAKDYFFPKTNTNEHRESYIQIMECAGLKTFYAKLNELLATNLEPQFAHITLYTKGSDMETSKGGIAINSQKEFEQLKPKPLTPAT